jgi:hypothetical protein
VRHGTRPILYALCILAVFAVGLAVGSRYRSSEVNAARQLPNEPETLQAWVTRDAAGFFTFLLVVVGGVQVVLFVWQLSLIRKSLDDAKIQAEAARGTLTTMRETAERQMRAYLYIEKTTFNFTLGDHWELTYRIKNCGQTPAHQVKLQYVVKAVDWNDGDPEIPELPSYKEDIDDTDDIELIGSIAPSGDYYEYEVRSSESSSAFVPNIRERNMAIYLVGHIRYATVFDTHQNTKFCYMVGGTLDGWDSKEMFAADEGNEAT